MEWQREWRIFVEKLTAMFEKELETYYKNLDRLRREHPLGGFVVIRGDEILDVWLNDFDALKEGFKAWGDDARFMIKELYEKPICFGFKLHEN